jgi:hypothetical protein
MSIAFGSNGHSLLGRSYNINYSQASCRVHVDNIEGEFHATVNQLLYDQASLQQNSFAYGSPSVINLRILSMTV